jgi:CheY-like chemotaxis protein
VPQPDGERLSRAARFARDHIARTCYDPAAKGRAMSTAKPPSGKTVLVTDDEPQIRRIVAQLLAIAGHAVTEAETGLRAIGLLQAGLRPDLIILDVRMPELDGLQTLTRIRRDLGLADVPVIMLTAQSSDDDLLAGYEGGADYYLTKPLKPDRLLNVVEFLIGDITPERRAQLEKLL